MLYLMQMVQQIILKCMLMETLIIVEHGQQKVFQEDTEHTLEHTK
jgi:hypothetical protein